MFLTFCSILLHFASMPVPRALLGALVAFWGSLLGAVVNPTRPKNHQKTYINFMSLAFCSMLLHFASKPLPRALLGAGVAFRALYYWRLESYILVLFDLFYYLPGVIGIWASSSGERGHKALRVRSYEHPGDADHRTRSN